MSLPQSAAALLERLERFGVRLGLETTRGLLAALGNPERKFPAVLVAGTNGKGSTAALLASMAGAAGYRVGLYTSPHLEHVEERIRVDGRAIAGERLGELLERVVATSERELGSPPTYFEALTAVAFLHLAGEAVDLAVLEVGMGGRLDATNAAEPILSLITPIGLDHREHLGATVSEIAREKAGIVRPGRPALVWPGGAEAEAALVAAARAKGAELVLAQEDIEVEVAPAELSAPQRVSLATRRERYELQLGLPGAHQVNNLALAVLAAERLGGLGFARLGGRAIEAGAARCRWPGRLETVDLPANRRVLLDAAHNPGGVEALAAFLAGLGEPYDLLFGTFADKQAAAMLPPLARGARRVVLTAPPGSRGRPPAELERLLPPSLPRLVEPDPGRALERALAGPGLLIATGSLYLVGDLRRRLRQGYGIPPPAVDPLFTEPAAAL